LHPTLSDISLSAIKTNRTVINEMKGAACGIYITRNEPTKPMIEFAKQQGQFKPENYPAFDRLEIVTVQEILDGAKMNLPLMEEVTRRARKVKADHQAGLFTRPLAKVA